MLLWSFLSMRRDAWLGVAFISICVQAVVLFYCATFSHRPLSVSRFAKSHFLWQLSFAFQTFESGIIVNCIIVWEDALL
jgi:hypothetical protein